MDTWMLFLQLVRLQVTHTSPHSKHQVIMSSVHGKLSSLSITTQLNWDLSLPTIAKSQDLLLQSSNSSIGTKELFFTSRICS